ncbi:septum formation family protein [Mycolicibacterium goodii]|uniref:septum formation family protein n=1 Tax=Mycolicibacterium goodii TaxID=134601 RepID=UPI000C26B62C|nr:septum formation family protein [Mycolicibacterium goodii]PJK18873.1 hypothetical protein CSX11_29210 [Mycolicibacterium goodii]
MTTPPGPPPPPYGAHGYPPPPPLPYGGDNGHIPPPPQKRRPRLRVLVAAVVVLAMLVAGAAVALYYMSERDATEAAEVKVGDCLAEIPDSSRVLYVQTVACDQPHKGEVFSVMQMPDGDFPGESAVLEYTDKCGPALKQYAPAAADDAAIRTLVLYPTADSWQRGDRTVTCIATSENSRTGKIG